MTYRLDVADLVVGGDAGRRLQPFAHRNATVRDGAALRVKLNAWRDYLKDKAAHKALQRASGRLLTRLVLANPVGNPAKWKRPMGRKGYVGGHSRRNWQFSLAPLVAVKPGIAPVSQVLREAQVAIDRLPKKQRRAYVSNVVPYIMRLNRGWSKQAAPGWIDRALTATIAELQRMK